MLLRIMLVAAFSLAGCAGNSTVRYEDSSASAANDVPARWERRVLHYDRDYEQRRLRVEKMLKTLGAANIVGTHTQAECLVLVPIKNDSEVTDQTPVVPARWEKMEFHAERGPFSGLYQDGISRIDYEQLKHHILRLFVTRNLRENGRDSFSVEVLYPASTVSDRQPQS